MLNGGLVDFGDETSSRDLRAEQRMGKLTPRDAA